MTDSLEQKDFITWWKDDFAPVVAAARKTLEPYIQKLQEISIALNTTLTRFIEEHKDVIELWINFAKIYPKLEPYINNIAVGLNDPEFEVANDVIEIAHIFDAIDLEKEPESISLMNVIAGKNFQQSLLSLYKNALLNQQRLALINEALELHNNKYYGGSICMLYGLLEGVLTESFEKASYIIISGPLHGVELC